MSPKYRFPITIYDSTEKLTEGATTLIRATLRRTSNDRTVSMVLAGGTTPKPVYESLRALEDIDWRNVHFFFGDERPVGPDHEDSNYRMANETLLQHIPVPEANVHRMRGEMGSAVAAEAYEQEIRDTLRVEDGQIPRFDLVLLGMGADGHTASLFPDTPALLEDDRLAVANTVPQLETTRITLTYPVLNAARQVLFLTTGEDKACAFKQVMTGDAQSAPPAAHVQPERGEVLWLVDLEAARKLSNDA
ncbi:MAG: 6-phosphogluconolactonase [Chloroflexota bacterium]